MSIWRNRCIGIALVSVSTLMLQVAYTRVFSISLWYHFVWMIISIALFGFGISGTFLMVYPNLSKRKTDKTLYFASLLYSISIIITYIVSNKVPFDPVKISWDNMQLAYLIVYYILLAIPFFLSGLASAIAIEKSDQKINVLYFSSFIGSAVGSIFVLPFFKYLGGSGVIVFTSLMGALGALFFLLNHRKGAPIFLGWFILLVIFLPFSQTVFPVNISPYKSMNIALRYQDAELIETHWNSYSRIDVVESGFIRYAPGLSLTYQGSIPHQIGIFVDGSELNAVTRYNGSLNSLEFINYLPSFLPYHLFSNPRSLVVDTGGGIGILTAIKGESEKITATEENEVIVDLLGDEYSDFSGDIYQKANVQTVISDGRSFIQSSKMEFDLIDLSLTGGVSPTSTGLYSVSENYLYTEEAFVSFIEHLSSEGILSVQRMLLPPPREDVRVVSIAISALDKIGVSKPETHIAVYRSWGTLNLLVGKTQFNDQQLSMIREFCSEMGFDVVYLSDITINEVNIYNKFPSPIYYEIITEIVEDRTEFYDDYLFDITATNDEKPFFFSFFKWNRLIETYNNLDNRWQALVEGGLLIPIVVIQSLILSLVFIILPVRGFDNGIDRKNVLYLSYFFLIGMGYMFIEVTTIQRFILVLGNPVYSVSLVLFSLLLSSGLGSYFSNRITSGGKSHLALLTSIGGISILYMVISPLVYYLLGLSFSIRIFVSMICICPLGFLMGMPFPLGIRLLSSKREIINWAWAVNGCASVIGSIIPTIIALYYGFSRVYLLAGVCYISTSLIILQKINEKIE